MFIPLRGFILSLSLLLLSFPVSAEEVSREQIKSLDEQVQDVKTDTLNIATQMRLLEEKLLYPSSTQIAVYVSMDNAAKYRVGSIEVRLDGKPVAQQSYSLKEHEALKMGGIQRIYVGNVRSGEHGLQVRMSGKTVGGSDFDREETFKFSKEAGPKTLDVHLVNAADQVITLKDW